MKVLIGSDDGVQAKAALRFVESIADRARAEITVLSVVPHPPLPSPLFSPVMAKTIATDTATGPQRAGLKADSLVAEGRPGAEIVRIVQEGSFDLVVLGGGLGTWLGSMLLGSTSLHVLHASPTSTLLVHEFLLSEQRVRVLVGTDGSSEAKLAADVFCEFADPRRCDTVVMSVVHPVMGLAYPYRIPAGHRGMELEQRLIEQARVIAAEGAERLRRKAFTARPEVLVGSPPTQLLKEADNLGADLVVVGSRGFGPVGRALMGSVSDAVSRHSRAALVGRHPRV